MRKEPDRRYASVQQFSDDILRHLEGRPVLARRDTFGYRSGKFVFGVTAPCMAAAMLAAAALGQPAFSDHPREAPRRVQRVRAERRFNDVRKLAGSFLFEFHDAIQDLPGSTPARALVVKRGLQYLGQPRSGERGRPRFAARARGRLPESRRRSGRAVFRQFRATRKARWPASARRSRCARRSRWTRPATQDVPKRFAVSLDSVGGALSQTGDQVGAFAAFRSALKIREAMVSADPKSVAARRALATSHHQIAGMLTDRGEYAEAFFLSRRKELAIFEALWREAPTDRTQRNVALAYKYTGGTLEALGDPPPLSRTTKRPSPSKWRAPRPTPRMPPPGSISPTAMER